MKIDRALAIRDAAIRRTADNYSALRSYHGTHVQLCEYRQAVRKDLHRYKAPNWVRTYVDGYASALDDALWREMLFAYTAPDGVLYWTGPAKRNGKLPAGFLTIESDYNGEPALRQCADWPCAHYWPTGQPFTEAKPINVGRRNAA